MTDVWENFEIWVFDTCERLLSWLAKAGKGAWVWALRISQVSSNHCSAMVNFVSAGTFDEQDNALVAQNKLYDFVIGFPLGSSFALLLNHPLKKRRMVRISALPTP